MSRPGWNARGDFVGVEAYLRSPFFPRLKHIIKLLPTFFGFVYYSFVSWWYGKGMFINIFRALKHKPFYGVPCGGIGCGAIGRDFRGAFCKYSLLPGLVEQEVTAIKANQFIVSIRNKQGDTPLYQKVLSCVPHLSSPLSKWDFGFPAKNIFYKGLYPRSWTEYEISEYGIKLICRQISPVIPHDYKDSSLPISLFVWTVVNSSAVDYLISIAFTFRNGTGNPLFDKESICSSEEFANEVCEGAKLHHTIKSLDVTYGIAVKKRDGLSISTADFNPCSDGMQIWTSLEENGGFDGMTINSSAELGIAVCGQFLSKAKVEADVEFCLVWDMPIVKFGTGVRTYRRRYVQFFRDEDNRPQQLCTHAFSSRSKWETKIETWQNKIFEDTSLPEWYKSALFNELYFMTDGGTCWMEYDEKWRELEKHLTDETVEHFKEFGRFAYLESWEYCMMNTFDVHFYSSFAIIRNWPRIELCIQFDFADQILNSDDRKIQLVDSGTPARLKKRGCVPHDLGNPKDEPWLNPNGYMFSDTSEWKDLNLKFILSCYRDYDRIVKSLQISGPRKYSILGRFYELSSMIIKDGFKNWDVDNDDLIENAGTADQTYDAWVMTGSSAYCGSLWLAALECCRRMALALGKVSDTKWLEEKLSNARKAYEKKLWNGKYFNFDEFSDNRNSIMTDQLCGIWYLAITDGTVEERIADESKVTSSLETIFDYNVKRFANGRLGPVNGMMPNGTVDLSSIQSEEVWGGVAYAFASFQLIMGMLDEGFETAEGWYRSCWERFGLQFQTPEAVDETRYYRAIGYMRPLAIWAMQYALDTRSDRAN